MVYGGNIEYNNITHMSDSFPTFLFTDIEGSSRLWDEQPDAMRAALNRHNILLQQTIETHKGIVFKTTGEAFHAAFSTASDAVAAAIAVQQALLTESRGEIPLRVRMALHTGTAWQHGGDYIGPAIDRLNRVLEVGHGGQILLSRAIREQLSDPDCKLNDLSEHYLKDLGYPERIFQVLFPGMPADFPPLRSLQSFSHNLPTRLTSFVGREREIAEIKSLLTGRDERTSLSMLPRRLVTLFGVGGAGKTRLALQVAAELLDAFADGVWLVELATLVDPDLLPQKIALALRVREETDYPMLVTLTDFLHNRQTLLLLDHCEHLVEACSRLTETLLRACPNLKIMVTGREALGVPGETPFHVPSLSLPPLGQDSSSAKRASSTIPEPTFPQSEAARLFVERAAVSQPGFSLTDQNAPLVAQLCHRLDGIPLTIELAAARLKASPVNQIVARIDNRFRLLTGGKQIALPRQQTLQAIFDWSHDLLSPSEHTLLRRLSVFVGGWTLEAAAEVCSEIYPPEEPAERRAGADRRTSAMPWPGMERRSGLERRAISAVSIAPEDVPDLLTHLASKALIVQEEHGDEVRYRMTETIRQYSREKLLSSGEAERTHSRHLSYFTWYVMAAGSKLWGAEENRWLSQLDIELDNLRAALEWSEASPKSTEVEAGLQLAGALWQFWLARGYWSEGRNRLTRLLSRADVSNQTTERARALNLAGILAWRQGDLSQARQFHTEGLVIGQNLGDKSNTAYALHGLGNIAFLEEELTAAQTHLQESLSLFRECEDKTGITMALFGLGEVALRKNDPTKAHSFFNESLEMYRQIGHQRGAARSLNAIGAAAKATKDLAAAQHCFNEALTIYRGLDDKPGMVESLTGLGTVAFSSKDYATALEWLKECLAINRKLGSKRNIVITLSRLEECARCLGDYAAARIFYEETLIILHELNPTEGIITSLHELGRTSISRGDPHQAATFFQEALTMALETGDKAGIATNLSGLASVFIMTGKPNYIRQAALFLGQTEALLETVGATLDKADQKCHDRAVVAVQNELGEGEFETALAEGRAMPLDKAVARALEKLNDC
jgi:predicted ATPase/class 3 adenylate cyclase